jgi:hypothetical protein
MFECLYRYGFIRVAALFVIILALLRSVAEPANLGP